MRAACFVVAFLVLATPLRADHFRVGFAQRDITPSKATPMWGYGARHAALSQGMLDPLHAKAVVIDVGETKLAIVGLDLGRSPRDDMMIRIRTAINEQAGVDYALISGSHTHHGPVIELLDEPGKGQGKFDDAVAYAVELERTIVEVVIAAAASVEPARIGWTAKAVAMNRNRHTKIEPKPLDSELGIICFDDAKGEPLAIVVNFAAHPTMVDAADLRFSADWPGQMMNTVEAQLKAPCIFMQGAAGDLSTQTTEATRGHKKFGQAMGLHVVDLVEQVETASPSTPSILGKDETFQFESRLPISNPIVRQLLGAAFFPELANAVAGGEAADNRIRPHLTTILINQQLALVGGSGEFFCDHAIRLKARSRADETFFFGYCNGHNLYFPTIEAAAEGGYGADATVSWVSIGAGEDMMNRSLINIYTMLGKFKFRLPGL